MTKKRVFVFLAVIIVMALSISLLVACNRPSDANNNGNGYGDNEQIADENLTPTAQLVYELNAEGTGYILTDAKVANENNIKAKKTTIVVADKYNELPVVGIAPEVFKDFKGLTKVTVIGDNLQYVGDRAFFNCSSIAEVKLGGGLKTIGNGAFRDCVALANITLPKKENTLESIGDSAFMNCAALASIEIPEGFKSFGLGAFRKCTKLESIVIPKSITVIGKQLFQECSGLKYVQLSEDTTAIKEEAFDRCNNLIVMQDKKIEIPTDKNAKVESKITIPSKVVEIERKAFNACGKMKKVILPSGITEIAEYTFFGSGITEIELQGKVTEIGVSAFEKCDSLKTINIPDTLRYIKENAFSGTSKLAEINLNQNLYEICDYAFSFSGLEEIHIPSGVSRIGKYAFQYCKKLKKVFFPATLKLIDEGAFRNAGKPEEITDAEGNVTETENLQITYDFTGTTEQWNAIVKKGPYFWGNDKTPVEIICHNGTTEERVPLVLTNIPEQSTEQEQA